MVDKNYGTFGLHDVSFNLQENCITGFIGTNGAGKTTTIRTLLGLALKDSGSIKIFGKDIITSFLLAFAVGIISMMVSIKIYSNKEL